MKVLIISHVPFSTQNNMGKTFLSLFSAFRKEELCQMYIYPSVPDVDVCGAYYRVTDKEVLKSFLLKKPGGELDSSLIRETAGRYEHPEDEAFYRSRKNKSALRRLARDAMWSLSRWDNDRLAAWLNREKPDCIFVAPGVAKFLYNFALKIGEDRNLPIVTYICDEYYFVKQPEQLLDKLRLHLLQKKIRKLVQSSSYLTVISEELRQHYQGEFGTLTTTLMTGTGYPIAEKPRSVQGPREICYFGNIRCNRYLSLADVGRALDDLNRKTGTDVKLKIYTAEKNEDILNTFSDIDSVQVCGFLTGEDFVQALHSAPRLLHVEAFDEASVDFVKHSISAKIADCLGSGVPLLAYGPEEISSMQHLIRNNCALTAVSQEQLEAMLKTAIFDEKAAEKAAENAIEAAKQYHDGEATSLRLRGILARAAEEGCL